MGLVERDALRTMIYSYMGLVLGYVNKVLLFILILSTEEIGLFNLIISVGLLFGQIASLGAINSTWKFFTFFRNPQRNNYGFLKLTILTVLVGATLTSGLVYVLEPFISDYYNEKSALFVDYYYWIIPIGIANVLFLVFEMHLRAMFKNVLSVFVNDIVLRLIVTALLGALYFSWISFYQFLVLNALAYFIPVLILFLYMVYIKEIKSLKVSIQVPKRFQKIILKYGAYSYLNGLGAVLIITLDSTMIASMVGLAGTGVYTTVIYLTSALQVPFKALFRISAPFVPVYWKERKMKEMGDLYKNVSGVSLIMGSTLFLLVWVNREELFSFLPSEYSSGIWVFLFLMSGRLFDMYMGLNSVILLTSKKYQIDILFTIILLGLVFGLNYWLIPIYGIIGAAISTMTAVTVYNLLRMVYVWKQFKINPFQKMQFAVLGLFGIVLTLFELLNIHLNIALLSIGVKTVLLILLFPLMIYLFKLNESTVNYIDKVLRTLKIKR
ncbi:MAG: polysaccharide biosynthesis C-terminal domain-containing protein [Crocinitomicaceae bacterium]|jgi:O-antigen/teichoic acid export membrane protein|nr:polysaccharide biosynthesis C-terminal domain-containing protein [Crocinitomicaceae bacterium]